MTITLEFKGIKESILFGFPIVDDLHHALNYCIILAKYFIHRQKLFENDDLDFYKYLCELKYNLKIERSICKSSKKFDKFDKYDFIYESM